MRIVMLLPLALAAVTAGGCRTAPEATERAALGVPQRDLTLQQAAAPEVEIASPVELARAPSEQPKTQRPRRAHRPAPARHPLPEVAPAALTMPPPAPPAATGLAASAPEEADPHALAPGQSVTIIPASSGPTTPTDWTDQLPSGRERGVEVGGGGHGGRCRPRGTGMPGRGLPAAFR
jgi:hypothetical protein